MTLPEQRLLTPAELGEYLSRRPKWVVINAQKLGGQKVGRYWRFDLDEVRARLPRLAGSFPAKAVAESEDVDPWAPTPLSAARMASKGGA